MPCDTQSSDGVGGGFSSLQNPSLIKKTGEEREVAEGRKDYALLDIGSVELEVSFPQPWPNPLYSPDSLSL